MLARHSNDKIPAMNTPIHTILLELREGLQRLYGPRLKGLHLFGSRARGQAVEGSDINIALILEGFASAADEISSFSPLVASLCLKHHCLISVVPIRENDWRTRKTPLLMNIRREGVPVT